MLMRRRLGGVRRREGQRYRPWDGVDRADPYYRVLCTRPLAGSRRREKDKTLTQPARLPGIHIRRRQRRPIQYPPLPPGARPNSPPPSSSPTSLAQPPVRTSPRRPDKTNPVPSHQRIDQHQAQHQSQPSRASRATEPSGGEEMSSCTRSKNGDVIRLPEKEKEIYSQKGKILPEEGGR
jgi:hypothetical protein